MKPCHVAMIIGLVGIAEPASACLVADNQEALIHSARPSRLPSNAILLDVEIDTGAPMSLYGAGLRARVRRVLRGNVRGAEIMLRTPFEGSCDAPFANGSSGLVVGFLIGEGPDQIFSPVFVRRSEGFQVRDRGPVVPRLPLAEPAVNDDL